MNRFNFIFTLIAILFSPIFCYAIELNNDSISIVDIINSNDSSTIRVIQPDMLNNRVLDTEDNADDTKKEKHKTHVSVGKQVYYQILAFNKANQRNNALALSQQINSQFPQYGAKVTTNLPYWQVWVGSFFNEDDAQRAARKLRNAFPKENITIRKKNIIVTQ